MADAQPASWETFKLHPNYRGKTRISKGVHSAAFSPNLSSRLVIGLAGKIRVYDCPISNQDDKEPCKFALVKTWEMHGEPITSLEYSTCGNLLVSASAGRIKAWFVYADPDARTSGGEETYESALLHEEPKKDSRIGCVAVSPQPEEDEEDPIPQDAEAATAAASVATASGNAGGAAAAAPTDTPPPRKRNLLTRFRPYASSKSGQPTPGSGDRQPAPSRRTPPPLLAAGLTNGSVKLLTSNTHTRPQPAQSDASDPGKDPAPISTPLLVLDGHAASVRAVAFSLDGTLLASGSDDGIVKIWDVISLRIVGGTEKESLHEFEVKSPVTSVAFSQTHFAVASDANSPQVHVWETQTWTKVPELRCGTAKSVTFSPYGNRLVCAGDEVAVFSTDDWEIVGGVNLNNSSVAAAAYCATGRRMAIAGSGKFAKARVFDMEHHLPDASFTIAKLIPKVQDKPPLVQALQDLDGLIGLRPVKNEIASIVNAHLETVKSRPLTAATHRNVRCYGPSGTGKSETAGHIARVFHAAGMVQLKSEACVEMEAADVIGPDLGRTEQRARKYLNENGVDAVLFFDEVNTFGPQKPEGADALAKQAVTAIIKFLDAHLGRTIMIVAGYDTASPDNIDTGFLRLNPGLRGRFPIALHFQPYSPRELVAIFRKKTTEKLWTLHAQCTDTVLLRLFEDHEQVFATDGDHPNARGVEHLLQKITEAHFNVDKPSTTLDLADVQNGFRMLQNLKPLPKQAGGAARPGHAPTSNMTSSVGVGPVATAPAVAARTRVLSVIQRVLVGLGVVGVLAVAGIALGLSLLIGPTLAALSVILFVAAVGYKCYKLWEYLTTELVPQTMGRLHATGRKLRERAAQLGESVVQRAAPIVQRAERAWRMLEMLLVLATVVLLLLAVVLASMLESFAVRTAVLLGILMLGIMVASTWQLLDLTRDEVLWALAHDDEMEDPKDDAEDEQRPEENGHHKQPQHANGLQNGEHAVPAEEEQLWEEPTPKKKAHELLLLASLACFRILYIGWTMWAKEIDAPPTITRYWFEGATLLFAFLVFIPLRVAFTT
eukprot:m.13556 g.13556  ORF g.13556 m.13556 type:complete len:1058 (+) comp4678_c0_seq2:430-3603(+)